MREILFRGKRVDNGEWVEGLIARIGEMGISNIVEKQFDILVPVKTETVGQYIGLTDKNGKKTFEGDIVVDRWANEYTPVFQNGIYMAYNPKHLTQNGPSTQFNVIWKDGCEIIGNIFDNPELLEAKNDRI